MQTDVLQKRQIMNNEVIQPRYFNQMLLFYEKEKINV